MAPGLAGVTVKLTVVVWVKLPDVPVIVTVEAPVAAVLLAASVRTDEAKDAVTPDGRADAVKVTVPLNPPTGVTVMVDLPVEPCVTDTLPGDADKLKSGATVAETLRLTVVV